MARTMIIASGLPPNLWPLATDSAAHIANRLVRPGHEKPPAQLWQEGIGITAKPPTLKHIRVWGCKAYVYLLTSNYKRI